MDFTLVEYRAGETLLYNNNKLSYTKSCIFKSCILHPTRVTCHSQTLNDDVFSNYVSKTAIFDNLTFKSSYKSSNMDHSDFGLNPNFWYLLEKKQHN